MNFRNLLFSIIMVSFTIVFGVFLFKKRNKVFSAENVVEFRLDTNLINLGSNDKNSKVVAHFALYNISKKPLYINSVTADCGCTIPSFSKKIVAPNDSVVVNLKYDSSMPGFFQESATVVSNAKQSPTILTIRGSINP